MTDAEAAIVAIVEIGVIVDCTSPQNHLISKVPPKTHFWFGCMLSSEE